MLLIDPHANEDFEDLVKTNETMNAVVIGLAPDKFHYEELTKAFRCLFAFSMLCNKIFFQYYFSSMFLTLYFQYLNIL